MSFNLPCIGKISFGSSSTAPLPTNTTTSEEKKTSEVVQPNKTESTETKQTEKQDPATVIAAKTLIAPSTSSSTSTTKVEEKKEEKKTEEKKETLTPTLTTGDLKKIEELVSLADEIEARKLSMNTASAKSSSSTTEAPKEKALNIAHFEGIFLSVIATCEDVSEDERSLTVESLNTLFNIARASAEPFQEKLLAILKNFCDQYVVPETQNGGSGLAILANIRESFDRLVPPLLDKNEDFLRLPS